MTQYCNHIVSNWGWNYFSGKTGLKKTSDILMQSSVQSIRAANTFNYTPTPHINYINLKNYV